MRVVIICCLLLFTAPAAALADSDSAGNSASPDTTDTTQAGTIPGDDAQPAPIRLVPQRAPDSNQAPAIADTTADQDALPTFDYSFTIEWAALNIGFDSGMEGRGRMDIALFTLNHGSISWTILELHPTYFIGPFGVSTRLYWRYGFDPDYSLELRVGGLATADIRLNSCQVENYFLFGPSLQVIRHYNHVTVGGGLDLQAFGWHGVGASTDACSSEYKPRFEAPFIVALYFRLGFQSIR